VLSQMAACFIFRVQALTLLFANLYLSSTKINIFSFIHYKGYHCNHIYLSCMFPVLCTGLHKDHYVKSTLKNIVNIPKADTDSGLSAGMSACINEGLLILISVPH